MRNRLILSFVWLALFLFSMVQGAGAQCAMCKEAAETALKSDPNSMARSLNTGIIYLMVVPYLMIAFIFRKQIAQLLKGLFAKRAVASPMQPDKTAEQTKSNPLT